MQAVLGHVEDAAVERADHLGERGGLAPGEVEQEVVAARGGGGVSVLEVLFGCGSERGHGVLRVRKAFANRGARSGLTTPDPPSDHDNRHSTGCSGRYEQ